MDNITQEEDNYRGSEPQIIRGDSGSGGFTSGAMDLAHFMEESASGNDSVHIVHKNLIPSKCLRFYHLRFIYHYIHFHDWQVMC